jgi:hypothetical protein
MKAKDALIGYLKNARKIGPEVAKKLALGMLRFEEMVHYVRVHINGDSGKQTYLKKSVDENVGEVSFHQGVLPENTAFAVDRIRLAYTTDASFTDPTLVEDYSANVTNFDAALRNGHVFCEQDGNTVFELPVFVCGSSADSEAASSRLDGYVFNSPPILEAGRAVNLGIEYANNESGSAQTVTDDNDERHLEIALFGLGYRER